MDVAAPPKAPAQQPVAQSAQTLAAAPPIPAPIAMTESQSPLAVKDAPSAPLTPAQAAANMPAPPTERPKESKKAPVPARGPADEGHTPVVLIVVTILAMLVLAGLAVLVYLNSQPSA
jgi:hypothetical protein